MQYMILIHNDEKAYRARPQAEAERSMAAYGAYSQALVAAGVMEGGNRLDVASKAKIVTVRENTARVVNGPYAETKEELGGYYLINVETEAEAVEWAKKCPGAVYGTVELRPCM